MLVRRSPSALGEEDMDPGGRPWGALARKHYRTLPKELDPLSVLPCVSGPQSYRYLYEY